MSTGYWDVAWNGENIKKEIDAKITKMSKKGAEIVAKEVRTNLQRGGKFPKSRRGQKGLLGTIKTMKSRYDKKMYMVGVLADNSGEWEKTFGAQAVFVEFGHAARGKGRSTVGAKNVSKHIPARPFFRPAMKKAKRKIYNSFKDGMK